MSNLVAVQRDFNRDWQQRPQIIPPGGSLSDAVGYRRTTTYVGVLEDYYAINQWEKRMVALGLADRPDLLLAVTAHRDDKKEVNRLCKEAKEAARASAAATTGTALHALTDVIDRGAQLPPLPPGPAASLEAFRHATAPLKVKAIEQKLVLDEHKVAGSADRIYEFEGKRYIGDTKSGSIDLGTLKIAMQLAVYARSYGYDVDTGERTIHGCSTQWGIVMHMPQTADARDASCTLHWIDLVKGWRAVMVARDVWAARAQTFAQLTDDFVPGVKPMTFEQRQEAAEAARAVAEAEAQEAALADAIRGCPDAEAVTQLWAGHGAQWTDWLTGVAKEHIATLGIAS